MRPDAYTPRFRPYTHQARANSRMWGLPAFALLMAMRTGKTKVLLDDWGRCEWEGLSDRLLVIAPGGVYRTWVKACDEHLSVDLRERCEVRAWESGKPQKDLEAWCSPGNAPRVLLINIEALSSVKRAREIAQLFLRNGRGSMVAVDESTGIKNGDAARTQFINSKLGGLAAYRRILSGLPSPKSPLDLYSQFEFLEWRIFALRSFYAFRATYSNTKDIIVDRRQNERGEWVGGRKIKKVVGFKNLDKLQRRIAPYSERVLLEDCYDLPPKSYAFRDVELTPEQRKAYADMKAFGTARLGETAHVTAVNVVSQMIRLHQILCGHTVDEEGREHTIPENRTAQLLELLQEYDGKAIVWCSYDADIRKVAAALDGEFGGTAARFWGGNKTTREAEEARFLNDPDCRWMVATAAAGGRGRTWMNADLVVYYSNTPDLEHRSQSEERPQGVGKTRPVHYVDLRALGTVDEKIIQALRDKIDLSAAVTGDNYKEWLI